MNAEPTWMTDVSAIPISIPLRAPVRFSTRAVSAREYVLVTVADDHGAQGTGYTYVGTSGALATALLIETVVRPVLVGRSSTDIEGAWAALYQDTLLLGRRGLVLRAMSAIDMALWDLLAKRVSQPLWALLGGTGDPVPAYASGGYYRPGDPVENVERELKRYAALGFTDFKIKVGGAELDVDVARVRAARNVIGANGRLALDANNAWRSPDEALRFVAAVEEFSPWWVEEPLSPDDVRGHAAIRQRSNVPIATGEIHATRWEFDDLIEAKAADILQPDVGVVGGVSEWMKVAQASAKAGLPVTPHWNANVHVHLAAAVDNCLAVEYFALEEDIFNFEALLAERLVPDAGTIPIADRPGLGLVFDDAAIQEYRLA
jgi:L-alanine-DL-glutamate epimerase-like enolase superfamily enzyme